MPPPLGVAQSTPRAGDVQANLEEHLRLARLAADEGARLLVFPELSLTGYELPRAGELAFAVDDPRLEPLREASARLGMALIAGAPVRLGTRLHIGALVLEPGGGVQLYAKQRLGAFSPAAACDGTVPAAEATVFAPGDRDLFLALGGCTAAVAVCADVGDAGHARRAAARGAAAYLASMFVIPSEFEGDAARLGGYAREHGLLVALANFGGPSGGLAAAGRSSLWAPTGELLVRLPPAGSGVAVVTPAAGGGWRSATALLGG